MNNDDSRLIAGQARGVSLKADAGTLAERNTLAVASGGGANHREWQRQIARRRDRANGPQARESARRFGRPWSPLRAVTE